MALRKMSEKAQIYAGMTDPIALYEAEFDAEDGSTYKEYALKECGDLTGPMSFEEAQEKLEAGADGNLLALLGDWAKTYADWYFVEHVEPDEWKGLDWAGFLQALANTNAPAWMDDGAYDDFLSYLDEEMSPLRLAYSDEELRAAWAKDGDFLATRDLWDMIQNG